MPKKCSEIGGQAIIEGVLMRNKDKIAIACRLPNNKIKVKKQNIRRPKKFLRLPVIRGIVTLIQTIYIGFEALTWSANQQLGKEEKISPMEFFWTILFSIAAVILFFVIAPLFVSSLITDNEIWFNVIDGIFRILIFAGYLIAITQMKDVKRIFQYHGAEHKVVNCYEAGKKLTVKNIEKFTTINPRCGTSFLLIVLILSIIIFSFVRGSWIIRVLSRIILLPLIAGFSYEILKFTAKHNENMLIRILVYPGLMLQKLTTKKPDKKQIEVALKAFNSVN